jgi:predicted nucleotidyltransferase
MRDYDAGIMKYNIYEKSLNQVKKTVLDIFRGEDMQIILFGSRARGDFNKFSDIDIGILPKNECNKKKLTILKEKLEDMNIPYKVEVVDISKVSQIFREKALKEGKIWKSWD